MKSSDDMHTLDFTMKEFVSTMAQLRSCYGLTETSLPVPLQDWLHIDVGQQDKVTLSISGDMGKLDSALDGLRVSRTMGLRKTLLLLTYIMRNSGQINEMVTEKLFGCLLERDMARLCEFMAEIPPGESIVLMGNKRSVKLANYSDWIRKRLVQPYMEQYMCSTADKDPSGETIQDPRVPMIVMGTYRLLFNGEPTKDITNEFCDLVLSLLKTQNIIPDTSEKDREWVRSEWECLNRA